LTLTTVSQFKRDLHSALEDRFALDKLQTAKHPFVTATVLDPATTACDMLDQGMRVAAYEHIRRLTRKIDTTSPSTSAAADDLSGEDDTMSSATPSKHQKLDARTTSLKFLASSVCPAGAESSDRADFDPYLEARATDDGTDTLQWWAANAYLYPATAAVAKQFLSIPATSAQSQRQFSAAGRLITKLHARLDPEQADTLIFLYENM